jgi:hypothetical protein
MQNVQHERQCPYGLLLLLSFLLFSPFFLMTAMQRATALAKLEDFLCER